MTVPMDRLLSNLSNLESGMKNPVLRSEMASHVETIGAWYQKAVRVMSNLDIAQLARANHDV
jgi:hypothetical protein